MLILCRYYKTLFIFNILLCSFNFETKIGTCHIDDKLNQKQVIQKIKNTAEDLIFQFGDIRNKGPFHIKIINKKEEWIKKFPHLDWAAGIATGNKIFINNSKILNSVDMLETISHEICHIYQHRIKKSSTFPSWFKEGMAMNFSKEISIDKRNIVSKSIWLKCLIDLKELNNISSLNTSQIELAYQEARLAYQMIVSKFNVKNIISEMNNNNLSFELAFKKVANITLNDFETEFDLKLINSDDKYIIFKQPMNWFFLSAITLIIIYIFIKFRNKKIIRKWEIEDELERLNEETIDNSND